MTHTTDGPDHGTIDAVPTRYGDTMFRSRLEADWAATLDGNRIKWHYEPETITLPSGAVYIPDFWLHELGIWIEAKGEGIPRIEKAAELAKARACRCPGDCACPWPGGELVLAGRAPLDITRTETGRWPGRGYANWETPFGPSAYYLHCPACSRNQWITLRRPWLCRACRHGLENQTAHRAIDRRVRFVESTPAGGFGDPVTEEGDEEPDAPDPGEWGDKR
ncbi:hypothetical protein [Streptomyces boncukensis]|uniref:Uncharacterized protein n=1 Tax=Streptomyces boncukensis TaxID=2711219 RepID=A0A6G4WRN0_9ACTN|nr:hypothetical protein [Streptomyces boncukensis]NGO67151.1 hypothetical protein [Streptomyces boncukensis]